MNRALALIETGTAKTAKQGLGRRLRAGSRLQITEKSA